MRLSVTFEGRRIYTTRQGTARQLLVKYDYPPDPEERAVELALEQAELFASEAT
ncbi:MAG TPA: type I restriction enzyme endonuclease domain-containing protein [Acidimicrobiales bacterium]|nr:type I restriction enzyme endonuclease domain-containing protein [Acidimicrobiales bacterium]